LGVEETAFHFRFCPLKSCFLLVVIMSVGFIQTGLTRGNCTWSAGASLCRRRGSTERFAQRSLPCSRQALFRSRRGVLAMSTQQETPWNIVTVVENTVECEDHHYIVVRVGVTKGKGSLCDAYRVPGMYVQIRENIDTKPAFLALSGPPNISGYFEFLVQKTESTAWLCEMPLGGLVEVSPVAGRGFPMDRLNLDGPEEKKPLDLILFATGSGIAPIRAAIESNLNGLSLPQRRSCTLYYGCRYPERMPYRDRFTFWTEDGVQVIPVISQPDKTSQEWAGRVGYVQHALEKDGIPHPAQTGVLLCGLKGMVQDVKKYCIEQGVPEDRLLLNF